MSSAWAATDVTASYIGNLDWVSGTNGEANGHTEADGIGWWNSQTWDGMHFARMAMPTRVGPQESVPQVL